MRNEHHLISHPGIHVQVQEVNKFDLSTGESVFLATPDSAAYGAGYVRECGSCVDYCGMWQGESKEHLVATQALSCKQVQEEKSEKKKTQYG